MLIVAEVKHLHSSDIDDLEKYRPEKDDYFCVSIQVMYGVENGEGAESFQVGVCSPAWFEQELQGADIIDGRHYLIVNKFNYQEIRDFFVSFGNSCTGETWDEVAEKLSQIGYWEFEDYNDYRP